MNIDVAVGRGKANQLIAELSIQTHGAIGDDKNALQVTENALRRLGAFVPMFYGKQLDYGVGNINKFGKLGVLVRLNDKVERLNSLWHDGRIPTHETVEDTLYDIIGYAIIGLLMQNGEWPEDCGD